MKFTIILLLFCVSLHTSSQNVGINTSTPRFPLSFNTADRVQQEGWL